MLGAGEKENLKRKDYGHIYVTNPSSSIFAYNLLNISPFNFNSLYALRFTVTDIVHIFSKGQ